MSDVGFEPVLDFPSDESDHMSKCMNYIFGMVVKTGFASIIE